MTVVGIVLMIVFALPAFNKPPENGSLAAGRLNGKKITNNDLGFSGQDIQILEHFGYDRYIAALALDERNPSLHWFLLVQEAKRYGFDSVALTDDQVSAQLEAIGFPPVEVDRWVHEAQSSPKAITEAFTHFQMILYLRAFATNLPEPLASIELAADQNFTKLKVTFASLNAANDWQSIPAPTEEQIKNQFSVYKGVIHTPLPASATAPLPPLPPLIAEHHFPFGYKYPDRVAVEYLKFDRAALRAYFKPTQEDYADAYKRYREHPDDPAFHNDVPAGTISTQPATKPFEQVQESLVNQQIDQRVNKQLKRILERAKSMAAEPWKPVPTDDKGYREALAADKWTSYQKIAEDIAKNKDFDGYKPEYKAIDSLTGTEDLAALPGIGSAAFQPANQQNAIPFPVLATQVRELVELTPKDTLGRLSLQAGVEGPDLQDEQGNFYMYRVTRVDKSHEPASVDEVRPQVIEDLKKFINYQRIDRAAHDLADAARGADLTSLAGLKSIPIQTPPEFNHVQNEAPPEIKGIRDFIDTAFSLLPGGAAGAATTSRPATQPETAAAVTTGTGATATLDNDSTLKVYVLQLRSVTPAKPAEFADAIRNRDSRELFPFLYQPDADIGAYAQQWFSLEALADRVHFKPTTAFAAKKNSSS